MFPRKRKEKALARIVRMGCNAGLFHFRGVFRMHVKRRRLPNFESCSVALFTSLVLGGATVPARAQTPVPPARSMNSTARTPITPLLRARPRAQMRVDESPDTAEPDGSISSPGFDESLK